MRPLLPLLVLTGLMAGCASTNVGSTTGSTQRTGFITLPMPPSSGTYGSTVRLTMRGEASCADEACSARAYHLLLANDGSSNFQQQNTSVRIVIGADTYTWPDLERQATRPRGAASAGSFGLRLPLEEDRFRRFAEAPEAQLWIGSNRIDLTLEDRAPLRELLAGS